MKIEDGSLIVESVDGAILVAVCSFAAITDKWPSVINWANYKWRFANQIELPPEYVGRCAGRAKYVRVV